MKTRRRPQRSKRERLITNKVVVIDGNFEQAFRLFKRKAKKANIRQECRNRRYYIKPSEKRRIARMKAVRLQKKMQNL